jgi:hypothetical protein
MIMIDDESLSFDKAKWPALRTVATLDWSEFDVSVKLDLPIDVWVEEPNAMRTDPRNTTHVFRSI